MNDLEYLTLNEYQLIARDTDQNDESGLEGLGFSLLGLFGEVGTLLSALKKKRRDRESFTGYQDAIIEEFGDVLWYFCNIASRANLNLSILAQRVFRDLRDWDEVEVHDFGAFEDIQSARDEDGGPDSPAFESALIALAGKTGLLLNNFHSDRILSNRDILSAHLVEIFRELINAANIADVDLALAARKNVLKIDSRWPKSLVYPPLFDEGLDSLEQLPRTITMHIFEKERHGKNYVFQQCQGINIGSALTDNSITDDDYRFHDVFHLAYAAVLGWSPVTRALFNLKRKSDPKVDEVQDGARAILIEEGISTIIFQRSLGLNYFESLNSLDYSLLKSISDIASGYEVEKCPLWLWEKAILDGFTVFRQLRHHRCGIVIADLNNRSITFKKIPDESSKIC